VKRLLLSLCCYLVAGATVGATWGGWALVTVDNPPERLVAGQPLELTFMVRQHGLTPIAKLRPRIEARAGGRLVEGTTWATSRDGSYGARITVPDTREWQITIHAGFGRSKGQLLPMRAEGQGAASLALAPVERGRLLFAAKGCVTCHVHRAVDLEGELARQGPDLTERRFPAEYLASFLANPAIKKPTREYFPMPNLALNTREISALVAFVNAERRLTSR